MSLREKLMRKPWEDDPMAFEDAAGGYVLDVKTVRTALTLFLAIVTVLFFLMSVAYNMRMGMADWQALNEPQLLWFNTVLLLLASAAYEWTKAVGRKGNAERQKIGLYLAGGLTLAFLIGQYAAWQQMLGQGLFARTNPSHAFFYMITAIHGAHLLGGLIAWSRAVGRMRQGEGVEKVADSVGLCAMYWHFLALVWIVMFALLLNT
jgi:cytochrome c oxidase subunit 3